MPDETATFEHFQIVRREDGSLFELGRGAMGVTYKAYDTRLDGYVALKVINPGYLNDDVGRERFLREARAAAHLDHPNVAAIFHRGQEGGTYFYAMQFIEGETIDAYVRRQGPLPVPLALRLILQAAQGLAAANGRGLIHRDVKPANLMLVHLDGSGLPTDPPESGGNDEDLLVKVIDFGLAKVVLDGKAGTDLSLTGDKPVGTPYYMSPEQIDSSLGEVDARTDIYSLGVTLWYLLTGRPPFVGTQFQVFRQHISAQPPVAQLPMAVPDSVRAFLARMMAKNPTDRPANTRDLINLLRELMRSPFVPTPSDLPPAPVNTPPPPTRTPTVPPIPAWPPPPVHSGEMPAAITDRPPPLPSSVAGMPPVLDRPGYVVPPPPTSSIPVRKASPGRSWAIFGAVLLGLLLLGGVVLSFIVPNSHRQAGDIHDTPAATPATSVATPAPTTASMWRANATANGNPSPSTVNSAPAGSRVLNVPGQFSTIGAAIDAARSGDTVQVGAGTFREKLEFKDGIRLVGAGRDQTVVSTNGSSDALDVKDCASGSITGMTFEHTGPNTPNDVEYVVWLQGSAVQMRDCRVRNSGSLGISCEAEDKSVVENCEIVGSHGFGLRAKGAGTAPTFHRNRVRTSGWSGIVFSDGAGGLAENNTSEDNTEFGISVTDKDTAPTLTGNTARHNKLSGIAYQKEAGGTASGNIAADNTEAGFRVSEAGTAPVLSDNQAKGNGLSGFIFIGGADGVLDSNTSDSNIGSGVMVSGAGTAPEIKHNHLTGNKLNGMFIGDGSVAVIASNIVSGNVQSGIFVTGKNTAPTLEENQLSSNGYDGISVRDGAGGVLDGNICDNNVQHGIGVYDAGTSPTLNDNRCENNPKGAIYVEKAAAPKQTGKYQGFFR